MATSAACFVLGRGTTVVSQAIWIWERVVSILRWIINLYSRGMLTFRPTNGLVHSKIMLKYRAPVLRIEIMITAPAKETNTGPTMRKQCSMQRLECHEMTNVTRKAVAYGGA